MFVYVALINGGEAKVGDLINVASQVLEHLNSLPQEFMVAPCMELFLAQTKGTIWLGIRALFPGGLYFLFVLSVNK